MLRPLVTCCTASSQKRFGGKETLDGLSSLESPGLSTIFTRTYLWNLASTATPPCLHLATQLWQCHWMVASMVVYSFDWGKSPNLESYKHSAWKDCKSRPVQPLSLSNSTVLSFLDNDQVSSNTQAPRQSLGYSHLANTTIRVQRTKPQITGFRPPTSHRLRQT